MYDLNIRVSFRARVISQAISRRPFTRMPGFDSGPDCVIFVVNKVALEQVFSAHFGLPVSIIPPMLHTHLHLSPAFIRRTNGRNLVNFKPSRVQPAIRKHRKEKQSPTVVPVSWSHGCPTRSPPGCIMRPACSVNKIYQLLFYHVRPANQPTIRDVALCHKKGFDAHALNG
jgi:hypothetical protein